MTINIDIATEMPKSMLYLSSLSHGPPLFKYSTKYPMICIISTRLFGQWFVGRKLVNTSLI